MKCIVVLLVIFSMGCTHTIIVVPKNPQEAVEEKLPIDIGLYISDEFRNYRISQPRLGDTWNYTNLGEVSSVQFRLGLERIFRIVEMVEEKPPFTKPRKTVLCAAVEPTIDMFYFDIPPMNVQIYPARIYYSITVYDMKGRVKLTKCIEGIGDTRGTQGFSFTRNPSISASRAIEDGVNKALDAILTSLEVKGGSGINGMPLHPSQLP